MKKKGKLSLWQIISFGCVGVAINLAMIGDQFGLIFMTDIAGVSAGLASTVISISTLVSAIVDPIIGNIADQTNTRWGKYRPYLMIAPIFACATMLLRFTIPEFGEMGLATFYGVVLVMFVISHACITVPVAALKITLSDDYNDRNYLNAVNTIAVTLVSSLIGVVALDAVERFGGGSRGWVTFTAICWIAGFVCVFLAQRTAKKIDVPGAIATPKKRPLVSQLWHMRKNKPVMCVAFAMLAVTFVTMMANTVSMHYYTYVLEDTSVLQKTSAYGLPISLAASFALPFLLKVLDKRHMLFIGFVIIMIRPVAIFIGGDSLSADFVVVLILLSRIGGAFFTPAITSWIPECVDWTNWYEGAGAAALISATITFAQTLGRSIAQASVGWLLEAAGFVGGAAITEEATQAILNMNGLYMIIGYCIVLIPIILFPISRAKADELRAKLRERDAEKKQEVKTK